MPPMSTKTATAVQTTMIPMARLRRPFTTQTATAMERAATVPREPLTAIRHLASLRTTPTAMIATTASTPALQKSVMPPMSTKTAMAVRTTVIPMARQLLERPTDTVMPTAMAMATRMPQPPPTAISPAASLQTTPTVMTAPLVRIQAPLRSVMPPMSTKTAMAVRMTTIPRARQAVVRQPTTWTSTSMDSETKTPQGPPIVMTLAMVRPQTKPTVTTMISTSTPWRVTPTTMA